MRTNQAPVDRHDTPRLRPVHHDLACGERIPCPEHGMLGPFLPAERLRNGTVIAHDCGQTWRPSDLVRRVA